MVNMTTVTILKISNQNDYINHNGYNAYTIVILPFIVCKSRTFGNNCSENCYCVSKHLCNKANGVCPVGGCERGFNCSTCSI